MSEKIPAKKGRPPLSEEVKAERKRLRSIEQANKVKKSRKESVWHNKAKFLGEKRIVSFYCVKGLWERFSEYCKKEKLIRAHARSYIMNTLITQFLDAQDNLAEQDASAL